jgi:GTP-binding protein
MRRKRSIHEIPEELSVLHAVRAIAVSRVVLLLVDATEEVAEQDQRIANLALRRGRGLVVALNKWDALEKKPAKPTFARPWMSEGNLDFIPVVRLSGKNAWNLEETFETINLVARNLERRVPTAELNVFLERAVHDHNPPAFRHRPVRLNYMTQAETSPPTFVIFTNHPQGIVDHYRRYIENRLRDAYDFTGVPIRLSFRAKSRKDRRN